MKKASIISVGNELLSGITVDTNSAYLSRRLLAMGIPTVSGFTARDEVDVIARALKQAADCADIVLITGGLGPTDDDLTRQAMAVFMGVELKLDEELLRDIKAFFDKRDIEMSTVNRIQAYLPAGAKALKNTLGTAPGIIAEHEGKIFISLPGVPSEMKRMFEESAADKLKYAGAGQVVIARKLKCFGAGESKIAQMLGDLMQRKRNPLINCTVSGGIITLHVIAAARQAQDAEKMVEADVTKIRGILGKLVYGQDEETLAEVVGKILAKNKKTIAVAESCTGGLIAKLLTDTPGASSYFKCGWVTYSNAAKVQQLSVPPELIEKNGAVSADVALAMAAGAMQKASVDCSIAVTGIAGPGGGSEQKPVGLVYIAVNIGPAVSVNRYVFSHLRPDVRLRASLTALDTLRRGLQI